MGKILYNKLIRDRIPEIIKQAGKVPVVSQLSGEQFLFYLRLKLLEECYELFSAKQTKDIIRETADLLEVLRALSEHYNIPWDTMEKERMLRLKERGGFSQALVLRAVCDAHEEQVPLQTPSDTPLPAIITRTGPASLFDILKRELDNSIHCRIAVAFLTRAMLNVLVRPLERFLAEGGRFQLLTSVMNNFNAPEDLLYLQREVPGSEVRIFYPNEEDEVQTFAEPPRAFHLKCFLFEKKDGRHSIIIGSSNMTIGGLSGNEEWNFFTNSEINLSFQVSRSKTIWQEARELFDFYWNHQSIEITDHFLSVYRPRWEQTRVLHAQIQSASQRFGSTPHPRPRAAQVEALKALAAFRRAGIDKCAVIAATGVGKTHIAAFDFRQSRFANVLFVVHREHVLRDAREVFRTVLGDAQFGVILSGEGDPGERRRALSTRTSVFATIQTLSQSHILSHFSRHQFDYIVVDEFHHSQASTYRRVLGHFEPRFLLGLTATPERMDGRDVLELCDYNIAYELRLFDAISQGLLVPFQYFAIHDETDYSQIKWTGAGYDEEQLERALSNDTRVDLIVRNLCRFRPCSGKTKALAFCVNKGHALYMTKEFNRRGIPAICLLAESTTQERTEGIRRLQDDNDPLTVVCSVDVLGEGVDIPAVTHILLLRPTLSFTVFTQQIGRGLRKYPGKDYVVVLDFVGNYRRSYVAPLVLRGFTSLPKNASEIKDAGFRLPDLCVVDADLPVQRVWDQELERLFKPRNREKVLVETYRFVRRTLGRSPSLIDFVANPEFCDPYAFIKHFGNWLRTKAKIGDIDEYEKSLLDTPGEYFLQHLERELHPTRSYKMVVLMILLEDVPVRTEWEVEFIARSFHDYYLTHPSLLPDYSVLAKANDPRTVPLSRIVQHILSYPLHYLSNTDEDFFILDRSTKRFALKSCVKSFWCDSRFRELVRDRVLYALVRYCQKKKLDVLSSIDLGPYRCADKTELDAGTAAESVTLLRIFPDLQVAAGVFREGRLEYETEKVAVMDPGRRYEGERHFVVRVRGDSMDGGRSPIHDGDLVVLEVIDAEHAGSLTSERAVAVEYRDDWGDTSYALKQIRKDRNGRYWLHSWNPRYPDIPVDPEQIFPFARLVRVLREGDLIRTRNQVLD